MKVLWYGDFYGVQERQLLIWVVERYIFGGFRGEFGCEIHQEQSQTDEK